MISAVKTVDSAVKMIVSAVATILSAVKTILSAVKTIVMACLVFKCFFQFFIGSFWNTFFGFSRDRFFLFLFVYCMVRTGFFPVFVLDLSKKPM